MKYTKDILNNGLTVVRVPMAGVKSLTVLALVKVGSRYEDDKVNGISHFLEHMVFKGTEKYPTAQDVASSVDAIGAEFNAFTSKEYTGYYVKSASKDVDIALDVVSDMLLTPKLREEDLEREKGVIIEELNMYEDSPMRHIGDVFERMFFAGTKLGRDIIGTKETIRGISQKDFQTHLNTWYGLHNMVLMIVGDADVVAKPALLKSAEQYFSKAGQDRATKTNHVFTGNPISNERIKIEYKKTEQAHFILAFPGIKRTDKDRYALNVLSTLLGGNMSSRLFTEVREKRGLCYYVHSDQDYYQETGMFGASAGVDPKRVEEAISVTFSEFNALINGTKPVTNEELKKAKDFSIGHLILGMEDSESVAQAYGLRQLLDGEIVMLDETIKRVSAVTLEDVNRVAKSLIKPAEVRFTMIGPFKNSAKFEKLLKI
ncbi:MAG: pitrilysin family protein [Patescibacteria group bacterium]